MSNAPHDEKIARAKAKMDAAYELARPVLFADHPLTRAWSEAYDDWIRARWDAGEHWVRSVWETRP
jgi:hypothetical protein